MSFGVSNSCGVTSAVRVDSVGQQNPSPTAGGRESNDKLLKKGAQGRVCKEKLLRKEIQ
jgi:hypothetical protein